MSNSPNTPRTNDFYGRWYQRLSEDNAKIEEIWEHARVLETELTAAQLAAKATEAVFDQITQNLTKERDAAIAERDKARESKRPFSDAFAQKVIDGQVKELDRLRAALSSHAEWQPIATAPKDGTWFLGAKGRDDHWEFYVMAWSVKSSLWFGYLGTFPPAVTHWKPIAPPALRP